MIAFSGYIGGQSLPWSGAAKIPSTSLCALAESKTRSLTKRHFVPVTRAQTLLSMAHCANIRSLKENFLKDIDAD